MKSKKTGFNSFLSVVLVLSMLFISWVVGYVVKDSVLGGFIYVGFFILGNLVGTLLSTLIVSIFKRK